MHGSPSPEAAPDTDQDPVPHSGRRRRWSDMSPAQQRAIIAAGIVQIALAAAAWTDLARRPASQVRGPKAAWAAAIAVNFAGPIAYFALGRRPAVDGQARIAALPSASATIPG